MRREEWIGRLLFGLVMIAIVAGMAIGAVKSDWKYNTADLYGANCIQVMLDRLFPGTGDVYHYTNGATELAANAVVQSNITDGAVSYAKMVVTYLTVTQDFVSACANDMTSCTTNHIVITNSLVERFY